MVKAELAELSSGAPMSPGDPETRCQYLEKLLGKFIIHSSHFNFIFFTFQSIFYILKIFFLLSKSFKNHSLIKKEIKL